MWMAALIRFARSISVALVVSLVGVNAHAASRLEGIKTRGVLTCGVHRGVAGFAAVDNSGRHAGLDVDVCRAVAAAIFADADQVKYVDAASVGQFLKANDVDIISRRLTRSLTRATGNGLMFGPTVFYDGQGFLVPKKHGIKKIEQLAGAAICVASEESHPATLAAYFRAQGWKLMAVPVDGGAQLRKALQSEQCVAYSTDLSALGAVRLKLASGPDAYDILPGLISKEPLAPLVRQGDDAFYEVVRWTIFAMVEAEERGLTSRNIDKAKNDADPDTQRFLGLIPGNGAALGLAEDWAYNVIKLVGNYGEMFDRNVGRHSAVRLERGLNRLWRDGGLMYAPRLR